jgi:hypothetical protein
VVDYLKAVPSLVPGVSVESHIDGLVLLQRRLDAGDRLAVEARKFLVEARSPRSSPRRDALWSDRPVARLRTTQDGRFLALARGSSERDTRGSPSNCRSALKAL